LRRISGGWLVILALVWWILAEPRAGAWVAGAVAVGLGVLLHSRLGGPSDARLRPRGVLAFLPFFVLHSFRGGIDVARRAFSPSLPLAPGFVPYRVRLPHGPPRTLFVNCISLLPGTFSAEFHDRELLVHLLASSEADVARLHRLEHKVAGMFGLELPPGEEAGAEGPGR
jgi:multicomponent Na+:H+ antiporter subunit E